MRGREPGQPKVGGRSKGTPNKTTSHGSLIEKYRALGFDPLELQMHFANGDWKALGYDSSIYVTEKEDGTESKTHAMRYVISPELRQKALRDITPYFYPARKAVEFTGADGGAVEFKDVSLKDELKGLDKERLKALIKKTEQNV